MLSAITDSGVDTHASDYHAALHMCEKYTPTGHLTPAQRAVDIAKRLRFSQCMRSDGVPNFPNPITGPNGGQAVDLGGEHIDPNSPMAQAANRACQKIIPGGK
jgi:hypothetical protein